jgi:hypothetical protein
MPDYFNGILEEGSVDMDGTAVTSAAANLFTMQDDVKKLNDECAEAQHHLTTKLLYHS